MKRVVLDTNVLVSGIYGYDREESTPGHILRRWVQGRYQLIIAPNIVDEVRKAFSKPYFFNQATSHRWVELIAMIEDQAELIVPAFIVEGIASHPEDDRVIAAAVSAEADYLVTGDAPLLKVGRYSGVSLIRPGDFREILESES